MAGVRWGLVGLVVTGLACAIAGSAAAGSNSSPTIPVLERHLANALTKAQTTLMLHLHKHRTGTQQFVTTIEWADLTNGDQRILDYDASGRLTTDTSRSYSGNATGPMNSRRVTVAYDAKTWSVSAGSLFCGGVGRASGCALPPPPSAACGCDLDPFTNFPAETPRVSLLGRQTIDRQQAFHLRFTVTGGPEPSTTDLWIERSTYLPVREKLVAREAETHGQPTHTVTNDFTWLPRSRANLAQLTSVIPHGFKRSRISYALG